MKKKRHSQAKDSMVIDYLKKIDIDKTPIVNKGRPMILVQNRNEMYKRNSDGQDIESSAYKYPKEVNNGKLIYRIDLNMKVRGNKKDSDVEKRETKRVLKKLHKKGYQHMNLNA
ncbi:hypothetical protein K502DRAFT_322693 [Neoconidiobolus thromboides FSU 785]|nr:hypothetical protein K502DRAFT_322693 [Neoconidiobolus thromboides FSU 785]